MIRIILAIALISSPALAQTVAPVAVPAPVVVAPAQPVPVLCKEIDSGKVLMCNEIGLNLSAVNIVRNSAGHLSLSGARNLGAGWGLSFRLPASLTGSDQISVGFALFGGLQTADAYGSFALAFPVSWSIPGLPPGSLGPALVLLSNVGGPNLGGLLIHPDGTCFEIVASLPIIQLATALLGQ